MDGPEEDGADQHEDLEPLQDHDAASVPAPAPAPAPTPAPASAPAPTPAPVTAPVEIEDTAVVQTARSPRRRRKPVNPFWI